MDSVLQALAWILDSLTTELGFPNSPSKYLLDSGIRSMLHAAKKKKTKSKTGNDITGLIRKRR